MKKVGIMTFHFVDNFGAVLQCYALQKVINKFSEAYAEVIDYRPVEFRYEKVWTNEKEKILFLKKREKFERFLIQYCNISSRKDPIVNGKRYDYYCVGSDQIWNTIHLNEEYLLPNVQDGHKFAYAASVGCSVSKLDLYKDKFAKYLPQFKEISVREKEHVEFISMVSGKECSCVLDPTLLLNVEDYQMLIQNIGDAVGEPYVLFYWLPHDRELFRGIELVNTIARKFKLRIVHSIPGAKETLFCQDGKCMYFEGVEKFLWYIKNADFVVTNSYHGTIFSLQFEIPFYTFVVESMKSRFSTLLEYGDFGDRIITNIMMFEKINDDIDYKRIKKDIFEHRKRSIVFLKKALEIV